MKTDQPPTAKLRAAFNQRMARNALEHQEQYSLRTGTILDARGFLDGVHHEEAEPEFSAIITQPDHPARVPAPLGPLLFYRSPSDAATLTCVELPELLLHPDQPIRTGALRLFHQLSAGLLTQTTVRALKYFAEEAASADKPAWQTAAVGLFDTLEEDYLLSLAGLRQSLFLGHGEMARKFVLRALNPSILAVDRLGSEITIVCTQRAEAARHIENIVQSARSLSEVCTAYFQAFGHLPLTGPLSLARAVGEWQLVSRAAAPTDSTWWQQVWSWVESDGSPLARYQALSLFAQRFDMVPEELRRELSSEILAFLEPAIVTGQNPPAWASGLRFRNATAVHYYNYLAARAAPLSEDVIGESAWWMAERFSSCFGTNPRVLERMLEGAVRPVSERSAYEAALTAPRSKRSNLCHATVFEDQLWSLGLLNHLGGEFMSASLPAFSIEEGDRFVRQLCRLLLSALPLVADNASAPVYAVDEPLTGTMQAWVAAVAETPFAAALKTLLAGESKRFAPETLLASLKDLTSLSREEQFSTVLTLRLLLSAGRAPNATVLADVSEPGWLADAMHRLDPEPCEALLGVLCAAPHPEHEAWLSWLYQLGTVCEQRSMGAERRTLIFEFIVIACAISDSAGPVSKLLNGQHRSLFSRDADLCRTKMEAAYPLCSQAVKATIRSITNLLYAR